MKKITALMLSCIMIMTFMFTGCHEHTFSEATCTTPATCTECGESEGEALGHSWIDATCESPDTCVRCGETQGEALGHSWIDATCESPDTCSRCGEEQGEPLGHDWKNADCYNPKTCKACGKTEGEKLEHNWQEATCENPKTCSLCKKTEGKALGHTVEVGKCDRCGQIQNYEILSKILNGLEGINSSNEKVNNYFSKSPSFTSVEAMYIYLSYAQKEIAEEREYLQNIYDACGDYSELSEIKSCAKAAMDNIPDAMTSSSDVSKFLTQTETYLAKLSLLGDAYSGLKLT